MNTSPLLQQLASAIAEGEPQKVAMLVEAGASIHELDEQGHNALLLAVHHRDIARDTRLLELLKLLISYGVELNHVTEYGESGLRVLSRLGRFDGVGLLLKAGADGKQLRWTGLHHAIALGTLSNMQRLLDEGQILEERDWWERTPWLLAILNGDIAKVSLLQEHGASIHARGRCGETPLAFAVMSRNPQMLKWLIDSGQDVNQTDAYEATALFVAVEANDTECAAILLSHGARVNHRNHIPEIALANARSFAMSQFLLDAGADIRELSREGRRALLGLKPDADVTVLAAVSAEDFARGRNRRFGTSNPERMDEPFWQAMIRAGVNGYMATETFKGPSSMRSGPVWCADRFGQSITFLDDKRRILIGGEHEDSYDPDFCIYNDVFVHEPDGRIIIYGYPESLFQPTDFHTATLVGPYIYVVGGLGYHGKRLFGHTPVYRLHTQSFVMEKLEATGDAPGWVYDHVARLRAPNQIEITSGKIATHNGAEEVHTENEKTFVLALDRLIWISS